MIVTAGQAACGEIISNYAATAAFTYMAYGTGTTAAALNQTALVTEVARGACDSIAETTKSVAGDTVRYLKIFDVPTATVITEVGLFNDDTAGTMLSRVVLTPAISCPNNSKFVGVIEITASDGGSL